MKAVMISVPPTMCEKVVNGDCTILVRKTRPKIDTPFKCYIYCTQAKYPIDSLRVLPNGRIEGWQIETANILGYYCNQSVIGEFVCDRISEYFYDQAFDESMGCFLNSFGYDIMSGELEQTCLSYEELEKYGNTNMLYGWHISDLVIYDKPREIGEFYRYKKCNSCMSGYESSACIFDEDCKVPYTIARPPQSWCYVEEKENE